MKDVYYQTKINRIASNLSSLKFNANKNERIEIWQK